MGQLQGNVAIITGAGSGFGEGMAAAYVREGAKIIIADLNAEAGERVAKALGANAKAVACDVANADSVKAMVKACDGLGENAAWLICDHPTIRRYGLGFVKPFPLPLTPHLNSGYLKRGRSLAELAAATGVHTAALERTVAEFNGPARRGEDPAFAKGSTAYNRSLGDPTVTPNPCVAPLERGPFYAVKLVIGDLGTFAGVKTDANAQVLNGDGAPIPGLYAAGNDNASIMGGNYPGGGITLGPAMTFGWVAARHMAGVSD